jgi:ArsR family transcriptional regulator
MADIFDVIADPTRRDVLGLLLASRHTELSVGQMVARLGLTQPTVSKHLKVLRDHGLVAVREEGQHRYYRLDAAPFGELDQWLAPYVDAAPLAAGTPGAVASLPGAQIGARVGRTVASIRHFNGR